MFGLLRSVDASARIGMDCAVACFDAGFMPPAHVWYLPIDSKLMHGRLAVLDSFELLVVAFT